MKKILSFRPLVFVGVISYSLYLWHWPLIVFSRYFSAEDLTTAGTSAVVAASLLVAFVSFEFIEAPFRNRRDGIGRRQIFSLGVAASVLASGAGLIFYYSHGLPQRYDEATRRLVIENTKRKDDYLEVCANWKQEVHAVQDLGLCGWGTELPHKVMFWGDSHVQQLYPLIGKLYDHDEFRGHGVVIAIAPGCLPAERLNTIGVGYHCDSFAHFAMKRADEQDIDTVFIAFNTSTRKTVCPSADGRCVETIPLKDAYERFLQELGERARQLTMDGKRVIISLPFPMYDKSIPDLAIRNAVFGTFGLGSEARDISFPGLRDRVEATARAAGADVFDPQKSLCDLQSCITQLNGVSIYKDDNHIAASQIDILEDNLKRTLHERLQFTSSNLSH